MKNIKLTLAAALLASALFSQSALAYGAVWKYGGNYGFGKGVGAVADFETQAEADRAAIAQCRKERPHWAARSKWGKCRIEERFQDRCAAFARFIVQGTRAVPPSDELSEPATITENHSSVLFHYVQEHDDLQGFMRTYGYGYSGHRSPESVFVDALKKIKVPGMCWEYTRANPDMGKNVNPKYRASPDFVSFRVDCNKPTHHDAVCDAVGYEVGRKE